MTGPRRAFLHRLARSELSLALVGTFAARGAGALGSVLLLATVGRLHGTEGVGLLALAQAIASTLVIVTAAGAPNALVRFVGRDRSAPATRAYVTHAMARALGWSALAGTMLVVGTGAVSEAFGQPDLARLLPSFGIALPALSGAHVAAGALKALRRPTIATLAEHGAVALLTAGLLLATAAFATPALEAVGTCFAIAAWILFAAAGFHLRSALPPRAAQPPGADLEGFRRSASAQFGLALVNVAQGTGMILLLGFLLPADALGLFRAAQQLAALVTFLLMANNAVFPPRFAAQFHAGDHAELGRTARLGTWVSGAVAAPIALAFALFPGEAMALIGGEFPAAADLLRVLALGTFVNAATGSVGFLIAVTGHEATLRNLHLWTTALALGTLVPATAYGGALGAAWVTTLLMVAQNLAKVHLAWTRVGVWPLPGPNPLAALGVAAARRA